ncbi:MAG: tRNA (adenosine(37)-N6)-threonylcarbamoyltransferase complex ATPase subunit type 1 TsaE [Chitinophagaceae bacterium]
MEQRFTLDRIEETARWAWNIIGARKVVALHGEMGAGKTTFVHALCDVKQVKDAVSSPTFAIINEYKGPDGKIYHIDLYRLNDEDEAIRAGVEDCLYSGNTVLVEWPEKAPGIFPDDTVHIWLQAVDSQTRYIRIADK